MSKKRICLDPGHYGLKYNKGAVSGYYESAIVWKLTMLEKEFLEKMGIEVVLTRTDVNDNPETTARGRMAKGCNLFVSNHTNACDTPSVNRVSVIYYVDKSGTNADERSKMFAGKVAPIVKKTMGVKEYKTYSRLSSNDRDKNGKKDDNYYGVLQGASEVKVPGVIIEHSFHTNEDTCRWLMNDNNLKKLAEACAKEMAEFVGVNVEDEVVKPAIKPEPAKPTIKEVTATGKASKFDEDLAGTYTTTSALHLRNGAGTTNRSLFVIPKGTKVKCYGYYSVVNGSKWLCIQFTMNGVKYTGFSGAAYLKK